MTEPFHRAVLRLSYASEQELDAKLIAVMTRRGYCVTRAAPERITVGQLAARLHRRVACISRALRRPSCPPYEATRGRKRILTLEPNARLLAWLGAGKDFWK